MEIPSFRINSILAHRDRLMDRVFYPRLRTTPQGDDLVALTADLAAALPQVPRDPLFETVRQLAGVELTPQLCLRFAWRVVGNIERLQAGQSIREWQVQFGDEWVPLQILTASPTRNQREELGFVFTFRVLAGWPCALIVDRFWSRRFCYVLSRQLGFTRRTGKLPYTDGRQLVNLRLLGKIEAAKSLQRPFFQELHCPPNCREHNQRLLAKRLRLEPCPQNFTHACHRCAVGYDVCDAATHPQTYTLQMCDACRNLAPFDPAASSLWCVACTEVAEIRRKS